MDSGTLMGLGTLFAMIAFLSICAWAWSGKRRAAFDEAANLPFADDHMKVSVSAPDQEDSK